MELLELMFLASCSLRAGVEAKMGKGADEKEINTEAVRLAYEMFLETLRRRQGRW